MNEFSGLQDLVGAVSGDGRLSDTLADRRALADDRGEWISYAALVDRAQQIARRLLSFGGGLAVVQAANDAETAIALIGAWGAGVTVALVDPQLAADARARLMTQFRPELAFDRSEGFVKTGLEGARITEGTSLLLSTSGTSGVAKFVRLASSAVAANASQIAKALDIKRGDVAIEHLPLHYSYGLSVLLSHWHRGAAVFVTERKITSPEWLGSMERAQGTHFPGVPFHYLTMARMGVEKVLPRSVTSFTQAGGHLDVEVRKSIHRQVEARGGRFYIMYGQTEAAPRMTTLDWRRFAAKPDSVGSSLAGGQIEIINAEGGLAAMGEIGAVVYRGPNVMLGYAVERGDLEKADELGGRLETGDFGELDADGDLYLRGRSQRIAKVAGLRIEVDEVERRLRAKFDVVLLPGNDCVTVFCEEGVDETALSKTLRDIAAEHRVPGRSFVVRVLRAIPYLASGKVDYRSLRDWGDV